MQTPGSTSQKAGCNQIEVRRYIRLALQQELASALSSDDTVQWPEFKTTVFSTAAKVIRYRKTHHKDWFDEQDSEACSLLDDMHEKHLIWMIDKSNSAKKSAYVQARGAAQRRLRQMKETWWSAERHDMMAFYDGYDGLKAVYGPRAGILSRWAEHFHSVLSQTTTFDPSVLLELPTWDTNYELMLPPYRNEIQRAINQHQDQTAFHRNCSSGEVQTLSTNWSHCISLSGAVGQSHKNSKMH